VECGYCTTDKDNSENINSVIEKPVLKNQSKNNIDLDDDDDDELLDSSKFISSNNRKRYKKDATLESNKTECFVNKENGYKKKSGEDTANPVVTILEKVKIFFQIKFQFK
jgi:hypothetical protein